MRPGWLQQLFGQVQPEVQPYLADSTQQESGQPAWAGLLMTLHRHSSNTAQKTVAEIGREIGAKWDSQTFVDCS
jgi:hypothetical protein